MELNSRRLHLTVKITRDRQAIPLERFRVLVIVWLGRKAQEKRARARGWRG